ncbi:MAG: phosphoenolpyruvate--protein phosphotransferase [Firmicutes bacterium]|jgi:phosphotransferase system enzyme I (PtsI)|nr:phosphoenolpyruvate--protein phosphotransferase [Bacillota bacterium]
MIRGIAASPGVAVGPAYVVGREDVRAQRRNIGVGDVQGQIERLKAAVAKAAEEIEALRASSASKEAADILGAQLMMLEDPGLMEAVESAVRNDLVTADWAVHEASERYAKVLEQVDDPYIKERAADVRDVGKRLVRLITGTGGGAPELDEPAVVIARDLTPSETAALRQDLVLGIAIDKGSATCHTAILARARGIPAVVGAAPVSSSVVPGVTVAIDGTAGTVEIAPAPQAMERYLEAMRNQEEERHRLAKTKFLPATTRDGVRVEVAANIGFPSDVPVALRNGAEGVGLFRTEFLFMKRDALPSEEEQFNAYAEVLSGMQGRPVIIRTLDIGGDKDIPYLDMPKEMNPFLGWRALRMCLDRPDMLRTQLRAIYRASVHGKAKIMFPMVATIEEVRSARRVVEDVVRELDRERVPYDPKVEIGIMVEIPSAALMAKSIGAEVDFFSIGTNDLTQYTMAVDRTNEKVAGLYDALHPSVVRLIAAVADGARANGIWAGMCGELAGDPLATVLLVGLGLTELSVSMPLIPKVKENVRGMTAEGARRVADRVMSMNTSGEIRGYLASLDVRKT